MNNIPLFADIAKIVRKADLTFSELVIVENFEDFVESQISSSSISEKLTNFEKIHCPFIRKFFDTNHEQLWAFQKKNNLRTSHDGLVYLTINEINPGYEWVFNDPDTIAVEKLDGTNIKVKIEKSRVSIIQNRDNDPIDILNIKTDNWRFIEGVFSTLFKNPKPDDEYAGELLGPKVQGNPYELDSHEWYPFPATSLKYTSFEKH